MWGFFISAFRNLNINIFPKIGALNDKISSGWSRLTGNIGSTMTTVVGGLRRSFSYILRLCSGNEVRVSILCGYDLDVAWVQGQKLSWEKDLSRHVRRYLYKNCTSYTPFTRFKGRYHWLESLTNHIGLLCSYQHDRWRSRYSDPSIWPVMITHQGRWSCMSIRIPDTLPYDNKWCCMAERQGIHEHWDRWSNIHLMIFGPSLNIPRFLQPMSSVHTIEHKVVDIRIERTQFGPLLWISLDFCFT
jgi:hypothetical protein